MQDEKDLIVRVQNGEKESYGILVDRYKGRLFSTAYSFTQNYEEAKDLSREAFVRCWRSIRSFKFRSSFYTYLYRALMNLCKDRARRNGAAGFVSLDDDDAGRKEPAAKEDVGKEVSMAELAKKLDEMIESLPFKQKSVFILRHIQGFSCEEAAGILRCRVGTVKAHLHFAIIKLREKLYRYERS